MNNQQIVMPATKKSVEPPQHACHNCRRQRLKCDRTTPHCLQCIKRDRECLGYQRLFLWQDGIASRGKMRGVTFKSQTKEKDCTVPEKDYSHQSSHDMVPRTLKDPLVQDLDASLRFYLSYYNSDVCPNLVLYDGPLQNPFRELIPLTHQNPILLQIVIANSALHMSNASQRSSRSLDSNVRACLQTCNHESTGRLRDALVAKQRALVMLNHALANPNYSTIDIILAVMVLFIEFELMDSGRNDWRHHIEGVRAMIKAICDTDPWDRLTVGSVRACLVYFLELSSTAYTDVFPTTRFDILGSAFASTKHKSSCARLSEINDSVNIASLLRDAEGNHCSSFPSALLQLLEAGVKVYDSDVSTCIDSRQEQLLILICAAKSFDPLVWATELQSRSPSADLWLRTHVASSHKTAVTLYLSRLLVSLYPATKPSCDFEAMVTDIVDNLSVIPKDNQLFTATTWPAFIAGMETNVVETQQFIATRFRELWEVEPWKLVRGALDILEGLWSKKSSITQQCGSMSSSDEIKGSDWIQYLRDMDADWLIL
ncbi:hypothetical protein E4T49_08491 [Aureobasidium sp. EXF-10728]|nr:hypothetical protein E4T49_08491 [Aureobasidium sp. EXF-10728]